MLRCSNRLRSVGPTDFPRVDPPLLHSIAQLAADVCGEEVVDAFLSAIRATVDVSPSGFAVVVNHRVCQLEALRRALLVEDALQVAHQKSAIRVVVGEARESLRDVSRVE